MSKASIKFLDGKIVAGLDANQDGENSLSVSLSVSEAIQEGLAAFKKDPAQPVLVEVPVKSVVFKMEEGKLLLNVDTDKDGEELLSLEIDMSESFEEISSQIFKSKSEEAVEA